MSEITDDELDLADGIRDLVFLIVDPGPTRKSIRALLSFFQVNGNNIHAVDNLVDAKQILEVKRPHVMFADAALVNAGAEDLVQLHRKHAAEAEMRSMFLLSSMSNAIAGCGPGEDDVDAVLIRPFTMETLRATFREVMVHKTAPTKYDLSLRRGKDFMEKEAWPEALGVFHQAMRETPRPSMACYHLGEILMALNKREEAVKSFETGLLFQNNHFRCLIGLLSAQIAAGEVKGAYQTGRKLVGSYPIPLKILPDMIRLSVLNQRYEDLIGFYQYADHLGKAPAVAQHMAAGLVVCGLDFLKRRKIPEGLDAFRKADVVSKGNPRILLRMVEALIAQGVEAEARNFFLRLTPEQQNSPSIQLAELEWVEKSGNPAAIYPVCDRIIRRDIRSEKAFRLAIIAARQLGRSKLALEELLHQATQAFPDQSKEFHDLLEMPLPPVAA